MMDDGAQFVTNMMNEMRFDTFRVDCVDPRLNLTPGQNRTLNLLARRRPACTGALGLWLRTRVTPFAAFFAAISIPAYVLSLVLPPTVSQAPGGGGAIAGQFLFLALLPLGVIAYRRVACTLRRPYLAAALPILRMEKCYHCGYSLIGHVDKTQPCPECGVAPAALICPTCGHWLAGLARSVDQCPGCGTARVHSMT